MHNAIAILQPRCVGDEAVMGWQRVRVGDVAEIKHGYAFAGEYFVDEPSTDVLLTPGNFAIGGGFKLDKPKYYRGPIPPDYVLNPGDVVVTMTDLSKSVDTLGYSAVVPRLSGYRFLHNQRIGRVEVRRRDLVTKDFMHWLLRTDAYRNEVIASASGSTVKHTAPKRIEAYGFQLPSLREQEAIARILGALDDKIELNRRTNETLEAMARALFQSWFVDFDPVRAKMEGRQPVGMDADTAKLFPQRFDSSPLGPVPRGWLVRPIGDVVEVVGGSTPSTTEPRLWGGPHCWATPKDLSDGNRPILSETARKITDEGLAGISSGTLLPGSVLLSSRAPIGYVAVAHIPVAINQGFIGMRCEGILPTHYVYFFVHERMPDIIARASGTTFLEVSKAAFRPMPVIVPEPEVLELFERNVAALFASIASHVAASQTLAALRDAVLPKLLSGELRVPDAERAVADAL